MPTDTQVNDLKINVLTEAQYEQISSPSSTELYLVPEVVDTTPTSGSTNPITSGGVYNALQNIPSQEQSDWNETDTTDPAYIKNKPTIPAAQVNSDWNASSGMAQILNKPNLAAVATSGSYNDLSNKPTIPDSTSDLTNDSGFITSSDVPTEVVWFTFSLSGITYTSSITPSQILTYLESNDKCVLGLYPNSKDTTKKDVYHCMNHTHDTAKNTYSLLFATAKERTLTYFLYDSTVGSWKQYEYPMQAYLIGSGTGQNIKTINNESLLGSGNITIHEGDDNVQSDWSQTNTSADDYIKNKPQNLVTDASYVHTDNNYTTTEKNKLAGIASGAEVNVQSDWNQSDSTADDYIKNKPTIPAVPTNVSAFTNDAGYLTQETDPTVPSWAKAASKPTYDYSEITNTPTIPTVPTHRTVNHEQITDSSLGDINLHDGFYFPNAVQDYDGNWYGAVVIGDQVWLGENLRTTHYADGTALTQAGDSDFSDSVPYYYYYNEEQLSRYGILYNWAAVMKGASSSDTVPSGVAGVAPTGFHVPSNAEVGVLATYVSNQKRYIFDNNPIKIGKALASTKFWGSNSTAGNVGNDKETNNATGFNFMPSGRRTEANGMQYVNNYGYIQTATEAAETTSYYYRLVRESSSLSNNNTPKNVFMPVRCLSDLTPLQFRDWYISQYGSLQHHLPQEIPSQVNADWNAASGAAEILNKPTIPSNTSDLTNNSGFITLSDVPSELPSISGNSGKVLAVNSGATGVEWIKPTTIYNGTTTPSSSLGSDGDIYIQTAS